MWKFLRRRRSTAGIDVGTAAVKTVSITFDSSVPHVNEICCIENPPTEKSSRKPKLSNAIPHPFDKVAVAMPPSLVDIQYFVLPPLPPEDLKSTVGNQMVGKLDYDLDEACVDYTVSVPVKRGNTELHRIVGFACRRADVRTVVKRVERSGSQVTVVDTIPMALMNVYRLCVGDFATQTVVGIDIGHETASFVIADRGVLLFSRNIPFHEHNDIDAVTENPEAVKELAYEIRRTIDYCQIHITPVSVDRVILSGGGALIPGSAEGLGRELNVTCETLDSFPTAVFQHGPREQEILEQVSVPRMAVAVGLALRFGGGE